MEKIRIKNLEEDVYYEKLDNGLEVYLYTKDDIYTNYVTFTTKYGSVYNDFVPIGESKIRSFPKGIAHFLEHKVFTEKEDPQPMEFFAKSGSLCNAYTTFRNTSYLFYATKDLKENIEYLLNYVQNIYLTEDDVEKEKGIISEEIHMYEDRPGDVLFEKVRLNTLNSSPYRNSIIGTVKDIESITKEDLETCYYTFYNPSNMFIVVTGSFDPEEIMSLIRENQNKKNFKIEDNIIKDISDELENPKIYPNTTNAKFLDIRNEVFHYCIQEPKDYKYYKNCQKDMIDEKYDVCIEIDEFKKYKYELGVDMPLTKNVFTEEAIEEVNKLKNKVVVLLKEILTDYYNKQAEI